MYSEYLLFFSILVANNDNFDITFDEFIDICDEDPKIFNEFREWFVAELEKQALYRTEVIGLEKVPEDERIVICANHKSNLDPILLSSNFKRQIHWMAKKALSKNALVRSFIEKLGAFFMILNCLNMLSYK